MIIREYKSEDRQQIEMCIAKLQDFEAQFVEGLLPGKEMASRYLEEAILKDCREKDGKIFVTETNNKIIGFAWCCVEEEPTDLMYYEPLRKVVYVGDLFVLEEYRSQGVGRGLVNKIEDYAKEKGLYFIKLQTNAKNNLARDIYKNLGFEEEEVVLIKRTG